LLFDPQTSGGLIAVVPASQSSDIINDLRAIGYEQASVIGEVIPREEDEFASLIYWSE
jgi:selenide,water dikinase